MKCFNFRYSKRCVIFPLLYEMFHFSIILKCDMFSLQHDIYIYIYIFVYICICVSPVFLQIIIVWNVWQEKTGMNRLEHASFCVRVSSWVTCALCIGCLVESVWDAYVYISTHLLFSVSYMLVLFFCFSSTCTLVCMLFSFACALFSVCCLKYVRRVASSNGCVCVL